jgi:hypothetical protein
MIAGDERFGFDPNAFVQRLIEETGISHVWEPVSTKVSGHKRIFCVDGKESPGQDPDTLAKRQTRQLVWGIWSRFSNSSDLLSHLDKEQVAALFADFLMDNIDLVRQVESSFRAGTGGGPVDLLAELERRAQHRA